MLIFPGALPVAPTTEQAFAVQLAPSVAKTVNPVASLSKGRNETGNQTGHQSGGPGGGILAPIPDPDRPTGPTPAFEANLLEVEREKTRAGPKLPESQPDEPKTQNTPEQYAKVPVPETHEVDIAL